MGNGNVRAPARYWLYALWVDPLTEQRFIKEGTLLRRHHEIPSPDGRFIHSFTYDEENIIAKPDQSNSMASEQADALTAYYRYLVGYRSLYNFRQEMTTG